MLSSLFGRKLSDFRKGEGSKVFYLAASSFFMMGAQWPLKTLQNGLLIGELGAAAQPNMRLVSVITCFILSFLYGQLVSMFRRETVLYIIVGFLTCVGLGFFSLLGLISSGVGFFNPGYVVAGFYLYVDMFTVLTIPTFWAFVNDLMNPEEAKRGYVFIVFAAQFGALVTTLAGRFLACDSSNNHYISLISTVFLLIFGGMIYFLVKNVGREHLKGYDSDHKAVTEKHKVPFLKGLILLAASPYVAGVFMMTAFQEILSSVMKYCLYSTVEASFIGNKAAIVSFLFDYALLIQIVSCTFSFSGGFFQNYLGVRACIVGYPFCLIICVLLAKLFPTLMIVSGAVAFMQGLHYALNKPCREILYIPTTKEVKYKSKAWIEVFGSRIFKATGAFANKLPASGLNMVVMLLPICWIGVASLVGKKYDDSVKHNKTVV